MGRFLSLYIVLLVVLSTAEGQILRSGSMGGVVYGLRDTEQHLGLYVFGGNPAALLRDRLIDRLLIVPQGQSEWGDYRRQYDPRRTNAFGIAFDGVKTLGDVGTFRGSTSYDVENRYDVFRTLKRAPYAGEAFFVTDTSTGDITFNGPSVAFAYGYELLRGFLVGGEVRYRVLDGLKDNCSQAKTTLRDVAGTAGVAWEPEEGLAVGFTFRPFDTQEHIEAEATSGLDVELFNVRGESFATRRVASSAEHRTRSTGEEYGLQGFWRPIQDLDLAARGRYHNLRTRDLIATSSDMNLETSHMQEESYSCEARARWHLCEALTMGASVGYASLRQWTSYPAQDLLVWDLTGHSVSVGGGMAWKLHSQGPLIALDCDFLMGVSDSVKCIDSRSSSYRTHGFRLRMGLEQEIASTLLAHGGYVYGHDDHDIVYRGDDVRIQVVTAGIQIHLSPTTKVEWSVAYSQWNTTVEAKRSGFSTRCVLQLLSF
jgi:hypothetical protein